MLSHDFLRFNAVALATVLVGAVTQAECFNFSYPIFKPQKGDDLTFFGDSYIASDTIQLTHNVLNNGGCGWVFYRRPLKLWSTGRGTLPFNSTFVINITPLTYPGGEGLAFILTGHPDIPANSVGKWLGIISENTMGSSTRGAVAVEFDTRKSYPEDLDDNHVSLDLNSIYSRKQESLSVNLSSGIDIKVKVQYDGQGLSIFVGENRSVPVIFESLNLYDYLPQKIYVGFSASTGVYAQINSVKSWEFSGLEAATENFNSHNLLGRGGFGTVYKGVLVNREVAVKRFSRNSHEGKRDFMAEITTISNLHHRNLVKLLGWCHERDELLLVYEFIPNKSLDKLVFCNQNHGVETNPVTLNWERRHGVIYGVAQALDCLHNGCEKRVLHGDTKASNVMLDSEFNARLGDFGLARIINPSDQTHHSTKAIAGTPGYMAPESFLIGRATVQTDVYAFGVLVLEVVCGRKPGRQSMQNNYNSSIVDWVWENYRGGSILDVVDLQLNGVFSKEQAECVLVLALASCHPNPYQRPSMRTALRVLAGEVAPPVIPMDRPAFVWPPAMPPSLNEDLEDYPFSRDQNTPSSQLIGR
ncbi:probable L-type lectin-domain containing receptor kinase S.5 [Vitis riparia]|uniref:probable L-type lectin-domain containing receptor kinase S.5 n=1 Tax=Vitis riparia TaxID=96939 RepID=UPI00155AFB24|nr:probable L-type lectin-domain containing receptor kinase S.5 [Vitis riparia]